MKRRTLAIVLAAVTAAAPALGQTALEQAKTYFTAGAAAYEKGNYLAAVQAFETAYKLAKRPTLVFSIAQAYRRQYYLDKQRSHLDESVRHYNLYLAMAPDGTRRGDVAEALAELEPIQRSLVAADPEGAVAIAPGPKAKAKTRLMVSSKTKGARVALDGKPPAESPLIAEVKPGNHKVVVSAPGYFPEEREVKAAEGGIVALDIPLRAKPAIINLKVASGAEVSVDGRLIGETPLAAPLRLDPGRHLIAVAKNGYEAYAEEIVVKNGETRTLDVPLEVTGQRIASHFLIGGGALGIAAGGAFAGIAFKKDRDAKDIKDSRRDVNISVDDVGRYEELRSERDNWRLASGIALGAGALVGVTGLMMRAFDEPKVKAPAPRELDQPEAPESLPEPSMEISAAPMAGPGFGGATIFGRF